MIPKYEPLAQKRLAIQDIRNWRRFFANVRDPWGPDDVVALTLKYQRSIGELRREIDVSECPLGKLYPRLDEKVSKRKAEYAWRDKIDQKTGAHSWVHISYKRWRRWVVAPIQTSEG